MLIRPAQQADLPALLDIYNEAVRNTTATFDLSAQTMEARQHWLDSHNRDNHPLLVCEMDGQIAGYVSLSPYAVKPAYASSVELSIYVGQAYRRQGVAAALMTAILDEARADERTHLVVSLITASNTASLCLHERFGFTRMGLLPECGYKFEAWQSVETWYLRV